MSQRPLAREQSVGRENDKTPGAVRPKKVLTSAHRAKHVERGKKMELYLKQGLHSEELVCSDKKDFTVRQHLSLRRHDCYVTTRTKAANPNLKYKHPRKARTLNHE